MKEQINKTEQLKGGERKMEQRKLERYSLAAGNLVKALVLTGIGAFSYFSTPGNSNSIISPNGKMNIETLLEKSNDVRHYIQRDGSHTYMVETDSVYNGETIGWILTDRDNDGFSESEHLFSIKN